MSSTETRTYNVGDRVRFERWTGRVYEAKLAYDRYLVEWDGAAFSQPFFHGPFSAEELAPDA